MSVLIGINVKDAAPWLPRFLRQVDKLEGNISRIAIIYGESQDSTFSMLDHWRRSTKYRVDIYSESYLPIEERGGAATLARVERDVQELLKRGDEEYYLKLDCDLVSLPKDLIPRLIDDNKDMVAPYVWTEARDPKTFFDVYCFRKNGCRFHPTDPPIEGKPLAVDSVGTCFLAERAVALAGVYSNPYPFIQFCASLKDKGYQVWADSAVNVIHVDLERYGIYHYPANVSLSYAPYISGRGEQISPEALQVEQFATRKAQYDDWVDKNAPSDSEWIKCFTASRPLITASYKVLNESKFLEYSLKSVYPFVDRIDIVEGAIKEAMPSANLDGSSIDDTVKIIKEFPDPQNKIRLIQGKWLTREHMQAKLLELCSSRWMLFIDGDEIVEGGKEAREFCASSLDGNTVHAKPGRFLNFWHDFRHIAYSLSPLGPWAKHGIPHAFLVYRDLPGLNFLASHTIAMDASGCPVSTAYLNLSQAKYNGRLKTLEGVNVYHFGNAKGVKSMKDKLALPHPRLLGAVPEDPWFSGKMPSDMVLEDFAGEFPEVLLAHPELNDIRIKITETKPVYRFEVLEDAGK